MSRVVRWVLAPLGWWLDRKYTKWANETDDES